MKKKHILMITLVLVISLLMTACAGTGGTTETGGDTENQEASNSSNSESSEREPLKIALLTKTLTNPYFVSNMKAFEKAVADIHPEDTVTTFDCNQDFNRELSIVEDCITEGYDVIVLTPIDYQGSSASVQKIVDAGIPCLLLEATANMEIADLSVTNNDFEAGYLAMKGLAEAMGGEGKIVCFDNSTNPVARAREEGRAKCLEEYPDIEIANIQDGSDATFTVDKIYDVMNNFLIADPDIKGVWCFMDPNAQGVVAALKNAGLQDQIHVVGIDGSEECCDLVREGEMLGTSAQFVNTITRVLAENMYKLLEEGELENPHIQICSLFIDKSLVDTDWQSYADTQPVTYIEP